MNKIHHPILPLLDTRNSHWLHEVSPYAPRYQSLAAAMKDSPIPTSHKNKSSQEQQGQSHAVCSSDTGKSLHWEDLEEGKGSFAYSCIFGRWLFQPGSLGQDGAAGLTPVCLWGQHFRINSPQCLRASCILSHCTLQSRTGENMLEEQQSSPNLLQSLP